jgi:hypothetical protein
MYTWGQKFGFGVTESVTLTSWNISLIIKTHHHTAAEVHCQGSCMTGFANHCNHQCMQVQPCG